MAVDVLHHDDGVIDHKTDGQHEREQGERVDGEVEHIHQREGADERDRDGDERDERGAEGPQEEKNDKHHEHDSLADGLIDVPHRFADEDGFVVGDLGDHAFRQRGEDAGHRRLHLVGDVERVGGRLLHHAERDRRLAVEADDAALVQRAKLGMADIREAYEVALHVLEDEIVELLRRLEIGLGEHGEFALHALDAAGGHIDVLPAKRVLDVLRGEVVGGEALGIEPDAHRIFALAEQGHGGNPAQRLQLILDVAVGVIGDLERRVPVAGEGDVEDRLGIGLDLLDDRLVDLVGEMSPHPCGAVAHVGGGIIGIALELETDGDLALFLAADRGEVVDALDA